MAPALKVERGYVRPEDERPVPAAPNGSAETDMDGDAMEGEPAYAASCAETGAIHGSPQGAAEPEEEDGIKPLPDRLLTELSAHRTLALRVALGERRDVAFLAALHALCLRAFYGYGLNSCLELDLKSVAFSAQAPGLNDTALARTLAQRRQDWAATLPKQPEDLWDSLAALGELPREALFAHCVGLSVNAVHEAYCRRPQALAHAGVLAEAVDLDMAAAGWTPTVDGYLGRVTKARILQAVREAKGEPAAQRIDHLKEGEMAEAAQELLAGSSWLPEPLRTPGQAMPQAVEVEPAAAVEAAGPAEDGAGAFAPQANDDGEADGFDSEADEAHAFAAE